MRFRPGQITNDPNVPKINPLFEFITLLIWLSLILAVIYYAAGVSVDYFAGLIPRELENKIGAHYKTAFKQSADSASAGELSALTHALAKTNGDSSAYNVILVDSPDINALAAPGNNIIVFSGLLKKVKSENELAFILSHELGHFHNRDHLKGLGRGLILLVLSSAVLGSDNPVSSAALNSVTGVEMKFSRDQERAADLFAVDLINSYYGHAAGAEEIIGSFKGIEKKPGIYYYFSTHPSPDERAGLIKAHIERKAYKTGAVKKLKKALRL